jgi:LysM repeat protein
VVCPHCGRELQAAPPRLLTWGAPLILILLFAGALLAQPGGAGPVAWTQRQSARVAAWVGSLSARLQPDITITTIPVADADADELVSQPAPTSAQVAVSTEMPATATPATEMPVVASAPTDTPPTPAPTSDEAVMPTATTPPSPTPPPSPTAAPPTPLPTATTAATATTTATATTAATAIAAAPATSVAIGRTTPAVTPTERGITTSAITATATVTATSRVVLALPTPTPVELAPTATPNIHRIRAGDTLFELALDNDISLETLLAANNLTEDDVYTIQPGDDIIIPDPNATDAPAVIASPTPTPTPTLAPEGVTYTIRAGDTLMAIGQRFDVNIQRILDANGMTLAQARSLRPGQELIIPGTTQATATPQPTATTSASVTPAITPVAATHAATPVAGIRLDTPVLRSPENGAAVQCGAGEQLTWAPAPFIQPNDVYVVHLGYVNGRDASGAEQVVWVLAQPRPSNVTLWQLDDSLCGLAPFDYGRQWRWFVDVAEKAADGTLIPVSRPSLTWGFAWQ